MGSRTGLDDVEKKKISPLPGLELRPLYLSARSQSLYRLSYPCSSPFTGDHTYLKSGNYLKIINVTNTKYQNYWLNMREGRQAHKADNLTAICESIV
jgi:hypothetical protein